MKMQLKLIEGKNEWKKNRIISSFEVKNIRDCSDEIDAN